MLLPAVTAAMVLADQACDAEARVIEPLTQAGKTAVMPPKATRKVQRPYDEELYNSKVTGHDASFMLHPLIVATYAAIAAQYGPLHPARPLR